MGYVSGVGGGVGEGGIVCICLDVIFSDASNFDLSIMLMRKGD